jgi:bacterioferritin-associated ferredoxin/NifU-like protein involved in Fe-S cluster formation
VYPPKVLEKLSSRRFAEKDGLPSASGRDARLDCGSAIVVELWIAPDTKRVTDVHYSTNGCGFLVAAACQLAGTVKGKKLSELLWAETSEAAVHRIYSENDIPPERSLCVKAVFDAFKNAFEDLRRRTASEFVGDSPLICSCFGVSEETIRAAVAEGASTADDVSEACNAGSGCGSCIMLIGEIIDAEVREQFPA